MAEGCTCFRKQAPQLRVPLITPVSPTHDDYLTLRTARGSSVASVMSG